MQIFPAEASLAPSFHRSSSVFWQLHWLAVLSKYSFVTLCRGLNVFQENDFRRLFDVFCLIYVYI